MEIKPVTSESFRLYGRIINEYDYDENVKRNLKNLQICQEIQ